MEQWLWRKMLRLDKSSFVVSFLIWPLALGMHLLMFGTGYQLKILNTVVLLVSILMVYALARVKKPSKILGHYEAMLRNITSLGYSHWMSRHPNENISFIDSFSSLPLRSKWPSHKSTLAFSGTIFNSWISEYKYITAKIAFLERHSLNSLLYPVKFLVKSLNRFIDSFSISWPKRWNIFNFHKYIVFHNRYGVKC